MHPMIKPALRRCWRDRQTVQYGVTPAHAVVLGPVDTATGSFLDLLDGTRSMARLREAAAGMGLARGTAERVVDRLTGAGLLEDAAAVRGAAVPGAAGERLRPDLASLSVLHPCPGTAPRLLAARRSAQVQVRGGGRVGGTLAALLAAAGVGRVEVADGGCVTAGDTAPGGVGPEQEGRRRSAALRRVVTRAAPWSRRPRGEPGRAGSGLDLVVFAPRDGLAAYAPDPEPARELLAAGRPHLYTGVLEATGFVGPLVLPGESACARCMWERRAAREPAWPLMVGQWRQARRTTVPACDVALAAVTAGAAASFVLSFLDGDGAAPPGVRGSFVLPGLRREEEAVRPYSECPCGAAEQEPEGLGEAAPASGMPQVTMATGPGGAGAPGASPRVGGASHVRSSP
ncbi:ThiF family adenylyltransferase [Streptomyces sp. WMMC897]|uniref:ThiF family adenylyltransferase n=1 Tax=Streptomyces sp. WMMC897 TaxID=3014782 RepID=UPI0022B6BF8D|nr:ThiF family adenylyltransferase [Streptomyces sp. WMMC897]MCZ7416657.1 ThiF family adenylyltransferase [Streptomyces sp. WMMC897]